MTTAAQGASMTQRALFPVLKEANWAHRQLAVTVPFPGVARPDAPLVAFADDAPGGYVFLMKSDAAGVDPYALFNACVARLAARPYDLASPFPGCAVSAGADLTAERILDRGFLSAVHQALQWGDLLVCVPHRAAFYALRADATPELRAQFVALVEFDAGRAPSLGHAPVSMLAFRVVDGVVRDAAPLRAIAAPQTATLATGAADGVTVPGVSLALLSLAAAARVLTVAVVAARVLHGGDLMWQVLWSLAPLALAGAMFTAPRLGAAVYVSGVAALLSVVARFALHATGGVAASLGVGALAAIAYFAAMVALWRGTRTPLATAGCVALGLGVLGGFAGFGTPFPALAAAGLTSLAVAAWQRWG